MSDEIDVGIVVFLAALAVRIAGVALTSITEINPYAEADADVFAAGAAEVAATISNGDIPHIPIPPERVVNLWGPILSSFWLVPGPSRLYARLFTAIVGTLAVFALYRLTRSLHSRQAGILAAVPAIGYPSFVFVHSTVLREAVILAGLLGVVYLLVGDPAWKWGPKGRGRYLLAIPLLAVTTVLRIENLVLYVLVGATTIYLVSLRRFLKPRFVMLVGFIGAVVIHPGIRSGLTFLETERRERIGGRTAYLPEFLPDTILKALIFAPVGALYFLFTPFPWMIETVADTVASAESLVSIVYSLFATFGIRALWKRSQTVTATLVVGLLVGIILYGMVNANVGTSIRQRQMFLWLIFLFGGVGLAERLDWNRFSSELRGGPLRYAIRDYL